MADVFRGEHPVVDASPLIFLAKGGYLELLRTVGSTILVPETVAEIFRRGPDDVTSGALRTTPWLQVVNSPPVPALIQAWDLGPGEASVLTLAHGHPGTPVIIDDLAGRRCASALAIPVRGTLGVVLAAERSGEITAARPIVERLLQAGMYFSRDVLDQTLALVGESRKQPGTFEEPKAPVYVDGEHFITLKGDHIAEEFQQMLEPHVESHYPARV